MMIQVAVSESQWPGIRCSPAGLNRILPLAQPGLAAAGWYGLSRPWLALPMGREDFCNGVALSFMFMLWFLRTGRR